MSDRDIRKIPFNDKERVETGAVQFGDDWPGLFVRGDDCLTLLFLLQKIGYTDDPFDPRYDARRFIDLISVVCGLDITI